MPETYHSQIEQKQKLLKQHQQNLNYLENQASLYGFEVPLALHNALKAERDAAATLERELSAMGVSSQVEPNWQALVIDEDSHWREIVACKIGQLGGRIIERKQISTAENEIIDDCSVVIIGLQKHPRSKSSTQQYIERLMKLGQRLPIILLVNWDNRDTAITLRQALRTANKQVTIATIFKENFDLFWFSQTVHQILVR
jgi:hypothetical protein